MALPQHITKDIGGVIWVDIPQAAANALVSVRNGDGTLLIGNATATVSDIATVITQALTAGNTAVVLGNATTVTSGEEFWVRTPDEKVRAKSVAGNVVTLWSPILQDHANGVTVEGTRISYAVAAANADTLFWDGRAEWTVNSATLVMTAVECTKYPLERQATVQDMYAEFPRADMYLDSHEDAERLLELSHEDVLSRLGGKGRARVYTGSREFTRAVVFCAWMNHFRRATSEDGQRLYERYRQELADELERMAEVVPRDENQDGAIEESERRAYRSIRLYRR